MLYILLHDWTEYQNQFISKYIYPLEYISTKVQNYISSSIFSTRTFLIHQFIRRTMSAATFHVIPCIIHQTRWWWWWRKIRRLGVNLTFTYEKTHNHVTNPKTFYMVVFAKNLNYQYKNYFTAGAGAGAVKTWNTERTDFKLQRS